MKVGGVGYWILDTGTGSLAHNSVLMHSDLVHITNVFEGVIYVPL